MKKFMVMAAGLMMAAVLSAMCADGKKYRRNQRTWNCPGRCGAAGDCRRRG